MSEPRKIQAAGKPAATAPTTREYLTFVLGGEEYGIDILKVREIKGWSRVTPIPNAPDYLLGIINLRGDLIPVLDLRRRFKLAEQTMGQLTVIIFITVNFGDHERVIGLVVDAVSEVRTVSDAMLQPPPEFGCQVDLAFIAGLSVLGETTVVILDIEKLFAGDFDDVFHDAA